MYIENYIESLKLTESIPSQNVIGQSHFVFLQMKNLLLNGFLANKPKSANSDINIRQHAQDIIHCWEVKQETILEPAIDTYGLSLTFLSYVAGSKMVSAAPSNPDTMTNTALEAIASSCANSYLNGGKVLYYHELYDGLISAFGLDSRNLFNLRLGSPPFGKPASWREPISSPSLLYLRPLRLPPQEGP